MYKSAEARDLRKPQTIKTTIANTGDEPEMVGQGLCGSIEAALEWRTDDARGEQCVLDDLRALVASVKELQAISRSSAEAPP